MVRYISSGLGIFSLRSEEKVKVKKKYKKKKDGEVKNKINEFSEFAFSKDAMESFEEEKCGL